MIIVITGSNKNLVLERYNSLNGMCYSFELFPEKEKGAVEIFQDCYNIVTHMKEKANAPHVIVTLNLDVVSCISHLGEKYDVDREFILVTEDGVQNCGTQVGPVFKEFNKVFTLLDNLWEEDKKA